MLGPASVRPHFRLAVMTGSRTARWNSRRRRLLISAAVLAGAALSNVGLVESANAATVSCSASSLVSAISLANITPGGGTVTLTSGCVYTLTSANNATDGGTGLPVISGKVTVQGNGASIARSTATGVPAFRLFDVASNGNLTLNALTVSNGLANSGVQGGGGVFSHGTLSVTASTFTGNSSPATTGTSGGAIDSSGTLKVATSTFSGNSAQEGGGIFNQNSALISNSTFTNNTALIYGGGALLNAAGTETLTGDTFVGNTGPGGGAIDNDTVLNISDSTFFNNTGGGNGGGAVENFGTTTLTQSTFSGNSSPYGANIFNYTGFTLSMKMDIVADRPRGEQLWRPGSDKGPGLQHRHRFFVWLQRDEPLPEQHPTTTRRARVERWADPDDGSAQLGVRPSTPFPLARPAAPAPPINVVSSAHRARDAISGPMK